MDAASLQCRTLVNEASQAQTILIAGPTASGKSALAAEIAAQTGGVIVNADSMQVYRELRLLSARPSLAEENALPHRLYGFVPAGTDYTVGAYLNDVAAVLAEIRQAGKTAILVGGTGLYFMALTQGLAQTPSIPPGLKAELERAADVGADLHARLQKLDPEAAARLSTADRPRIVRALEVVLSTGKPLAYWQKHANGPPLLMRGMWVGVFLAVPRAELVARIDRRFRAMIEAGVLDEVKALAKLGLPPNRGVMKAHGVPHLMAHLRGEITLEAAIERGIIDTRRYAKRQMTFARGQLDGFTFASLDEARQRIDEALSAFADDVQPRWRDDLDALEFTPLGHQGRCVIHRLAFRKALGTTPSPADCLALVTEKRGLFEIAARTKIERAGLASFQSFHLTSRDFSAAIFKAEKTAG